MWRKRIISLLGFEGLNTRRMISQGILISLTIYLPFFLQNWHENSRESELNERYKVVLMEDLYTDLDLIKLNAASLQVYSDSAIAILTNAALDSNQLLKRANGTLRLGSTGDFVATTDVDAYVYQFREHGNIGDINLIRRLNKLKMGYNLIDMIETRRMDFILNYYTPIFVHQYGFNGSAFYPMDLTYFKTDEFQNTVMMFQQLAGQLQILYKNTEALIRAALQVLGENVLEVPVAEPAQ